MRLLLLLGGLIGFLIGLGFGLAHGSAWPAVIWRASVAALVSGILLRWWGQVWVKSLRQAHFERATAALEAKTESTPAKNRAAV